MTREVVRVGWDGATVLVGGHERHVAWDTLRAAATQDDEALRAVYAPLWEAARKAARAERKLVVRARNVSGGQDDAGALTWAAEIFTMAGEHVTCRTVAADWGQTGARAYALRDVEEASRVLTERGYEVRAR